MASPEAEKFKALGNEALQAKNYDEAVRNYNKAIALDPDNAAYYSNRSAAWAHLNKHEDALKDAQKCVERDPNFIKAYSRMGTALLELGRLQEAEDAYKTGLTKEKAENVNEQHACKIGLKSVGEKRQRQAYSSSSSSSSSAGAAASASFAARIRHGFDRMKRGLPASVTQLLRGRGGAAGGRMSRMTLMIGAYLVFTLVTRFFFSRSDDAKPAGAAALTGFAVGRNFVSLDDDLQLSFLFGAPASGAAEATIVLLHQTGLSAESEFGKVVHELAKETKMKVFALDRPCHGYSSCPVGGEPAANTVKWIGSALAKLLKSKGTLHFGASGTAAASQALLLSAKSGGGSFAPGKLVLIDAHASPLADRMPKVDAVRELADWITLPAPAALPSASALADAARWRTSPFVEDWTEPRDVALTNVDLRAVALIYSDSDHDMTLLDTLERKGVNAAVQVVVGGDGFAAVRQPTRWVAAFTNFVASPADLD